MGSRSLKGDCEEVIFPGLEASPVVPIPRALDGAAIVILAIPAKGLLPFADTYGPLLAGKVVVDVTNPSPEDLRHMAATLGGAAPAPAKRALRPSKAVATVVGAAMRDADARDQAHRARSAAAAAAAGGQGAFGGGFGTKDVSDIEAFEGCTAVLPASSQSAALLLQECLSRVAPGAAVVKSMCNLSSYMLLHGDPLTDIMKTVAASDSPEAAAAFQTLGQAMGLEVRTGPGLRYASTLEARQRGVLTDWQVSFWVMLISWVLMQIYTAVRYNQYGNEPWEHIVMWITNKSIGWLSLWGMMYTYAPGTIVWMDMRKPLGLLTLAALIMHLLLSTFLWAPGYYASERL
ncbi:hypothetical protein MNEG_4312 [Monoraphidium neglectum]|uniref:Pyrroline-5-carboxylate reductase catalytic N-terminal domain-containing protein n=1 Tax=Monoraphidium neglectum TaxID=145388 RepID=A0A0D2LA72_9CHLO|nr:hypothetical protein MNEG_4312 [Monoraphidium neglectum]KIZ03649.1 hypothetical protein MNEG_4312 [Monoraphidium neglectum]|eukprot:XP_013902668.1 hypothetical protein MNEG_4312 [Monoraphidium neglectum]